MECFKGRLRHALFMYLAAGLVACSSVERTVQSQDNSSTLGELPAAFIPAKPKVDDSSLDIVAAGYKVLLH